MVSLDISALAGDDTLTGLLMTCAGAWMEAALADPAGGKRLVIYDEAWHLMRQPALLVRMQQQWKLSRAWGIANLMVIHRLSDLEAVGADRLRPGRWPPGCSVTPPSGSSIWSPSTRPRRRGSNSACPRSRSPSSRISRKVTASGGSASAAFVVHHLITPDEARLFDTNQRMHQP